LMAAFLDDGKRLALLVMPLTSSISIAGTVKVAAAKAEAVASSWTWRQVKRMSRSLVPSDGLKTCL
jgi:hypothetical protein